MKKYVETCIIILFLELMILTVANVYILTSLKTEGRLYRVEASRIEKLLAAGTKAEEIKLSDYTTITGIGRFTKSSDISDDYLVTNCDGDLYYISYQSGSQTGERLWLVNIVGLAMLLMSIAACAYIGKTVVKPFSKIKEMPYELSKGNLVIPVKEEKNKVFGRFLWGMDLLRENLEESKEEELRLQKEKKTLLLSISHDIKTPLSSIKLYARALKEDLYTDDAKKREVYNGILNNTEEIEKYVNEIIKASKEDFLNLSVHNDNVYLEKIIRRIDEYYKDKLEPKKTQWIVEAYENCILSGDEERLIEVLQNIIENAIKYGDGEYIRLSVTEEEDCKLISVKNSGEPIREEELPHLFDSFYRGSNVKNKKGSGLGLYICRTLMRMMEGDVFVKTDAHANEFTVVVRKSNDNH